MPAMVLPQGLERRGRVHPAVPLGVGLCGAIALTLALSRESALPRADFVFANGGEVSSLDPHGGTGIPEARVLRALYEGLVTHAPATLEPAPGVAESWEVSEDGREYVFHLRENARWSNGDPVTADDFLWSFLRLLDPETAAPYAYELHCVEGALNYVLGRDEAGAVLARDPARVGLSARDAHTFVVRLERPAAHFLDMLAFNAFYPVHRASLEALRERDPLGWRTAWSRPGNLVTNGPYLLALRRVNDRMRLAKNPHYWGADQVAFETVDALALEHWGTALNLYLTGEIDWLDGMLPALLVPRLLQREDLLCAPYLGSYFLRVNVTKPPLDDVRVRRALALTLPRGIICQQLLKAGQEPAYTIVPWGRAGDYRSPPSFHSDLEEARKLLEEAGFGPKGEKFPPIALHYNTSESHRDIAEVVAATWRSVLGLDVRLENQEWKVFLDTQIHLDYDISRSSWIADYADPLGFLKIFTTGNENNRTGYSNVAFDALIAAAGAEPGGARRNELMAEAEALLLEDLPVLPVYSYVTQNLVSPRLGGFRTNELNEHSPRDLYWMDDAELQATRARRGPGKGRAPVFGPGAGLYSPRAQRERAAAEKAR
jgi:oligopeptide transport system substrate-binding protein